MTNEADKRTRVYVVTDCWPPRRARPPFAWIFCPCLRGLSPAQSIWLSALPMHDANGELLAAIRRPGFRNAARRPDFVGLFMLDPFRRIDLILEEIRAAGILGIVNLPTVQAFEGELQTALHHVGLGTEKETEALEAADRFGLKMLRLARSPDTGWCLIEEENGGATDILSYPEWLRIARRGQPAPRSHYSGLGEGARQKGAARGWRSRATS